MTSADQMDASINPADEAVKAFHDVKDFISAAQGLIEDHASLLNHSGKRLGFERDPFHLAINDHRSLRDLNENAYSDWLAWVLEVACGASNHPAALCQALFSNDSLDNTLQGVDATGSPRIQRETKVSHGHEGREGRTDLLIDFPQARRLWHIEVSYLGRKWGSGKAFRLC